jgi:hypothetical protein
MHVPMQDLAQATVVQLLYALAPVHEQNKLGLKAYTSQPDIIPDRRTATRQQCTFDCARVDRKCFLGPCVDCFVYRSIQ